MRMSSINNKNITWTSLAIMTFTAIWGFQNAINGFSNFNGIKAIVPWLFVMLLYFLPYCLMVGELGSTFSDTTGGVASWVGKLSFPVLAFLTGWVYWAALLPFISQKPSNVLTALSWVFFGQNSLNSLSPYVIQPICLCLFLFAVFVAQKGVGVISKISSIAGSFMFVMSMLFILLLIAAPAISNGRSLVPIEWTWETFKPTINTNFMSSLCILILAVGGAEVISPYANKLKDKKNGYKKGIIAAAVMVMICAVLGTVAIAFVIDPEEISSGKFDMANGAYIAFQRVGEYYFGNLNIAGFPMKNLLMVIYGMAQATVQFSVLMVDIDAPLRMLLRHENKEFLPESLFKKNKKGVYINGYKVMMVIVIVLILLPIISGNSISQTINWLTKLSSVCVPITFEFVFVSYILLKKKQDKFNSPGFKFVKNKYLGMAIGLWCFLVTAVAIVMGVYSPVPFEMISNIAIPVVLIALGFSMILIKKLADTGRVSKENTDVNETETANK